ncbi:tankyrase-1 [Artemisia annua]|uniref:Tankyrase-1 n=1 Tax=Artemisia annua TaxID=35608 RepID=A0A2U1KU95_ARTAN|nr:tankyrase-1 [Artemisia annua]
MQRVKDSSRSVTKPITIHALCNSGDLSGVIKLLRDNPSLINDRNPVLDTPAPALTQKAVEVALVLDSSYIFM